MSALTRRAALASVASLTTGCIMPTNDKLDAVHFSSMLGLKGVADAVTKSRFGRSYRFSPAQTGEPLDCWAGEPPLGTTAVISRPKILFRQTIARISADDLAALSYLPGEWKLSLNSRPLPNPETGLYEPSPYYDGDLLLAPLVAEITFGTGAAAHRVEMDACGNTISLPAMDVTVDVGISQVCGITADGGSTNLGLFSLYEVEAVLHKSSGVDDNATRTILNQNANVCFPVYDFATSWCYLTQGALAYQEDIMGGNNVVCYAGGDGNIAAAPAPFPQIVERIPADIASSNARLHCFRPFHPHAKAIQFSLQATGNETVFPGSLIQRLEF